MQNTDFSVQLSMKQLISYVFPIHNEEQNIDVLHVELLKVFEELDVEFEFEVICVNDGSTDNSLEKLIHLHNKDNRFKVINFSRNFGHQMAITAGTDYAKGDAVIIMDADLQDPPAVSVELIRKWKEGFEVVYAQRRTRQDSFFKKTTAYVFYRLLDSLANIKIPKDTGDFRLMDRKVVDTIKAFREKNRFMRGIAAYVGFKQTAVLFNRSARHAGETNYPLSKMIKLAFDGITSFSTVPLEFISRIGWIVSLLSFFGIIYAVVLRIFFPQITVSGWTFLACSVLFTGGVQMIMLGILGTYIGRIYTEVQKRPLYIVESILE